MGRHDITLGAAWRISKRNTWRMFWAYFFCLLPWVATLTWIPFWRFLLVPSRASVAVVQLVMGLIWISVGMISVGMLSLAYRHFFERPA